MTTKGAEAEIIARERGLLESWSSGRPSGYFDAAASDITYFDDIGAMEGIRGRDVARTYAAGLDGQIPPHDYRMVAPTVQVVGDVAVLTFRYHPSKNGEPLQKWKATSVYRREGDAWSQIHAHWSMQKNG